MALPGRTILSRNILTGLRHPPTQAQPCGIDLTLKSLSAFTGAGTLDFSNTLRQTAPAEKLASPSEEQTEGRPRYWHLQPGAYIVEFNEKVAVPLDVVGFVLPRSSFWRSGGMIESGVCDAGYEGAMGCLVQVINPHGMKLYEHARIAQMVFLGMAGDVGEGYRGVYQGAESI